MVLEVDLDHFIAESEHYSMSGSHPLLDIDDISYLPFGELIFRKRVGFWFLATLQVASEML
jgi:hypothetical protein